MDIKTFSCFWWLGQKQLRQQMGSVQKHRNYQ